MHVQFIDRTTGPERLMCEAEIVFDEPGPLQGMKLVGFSLWRGADSEVYVTFPSRAFGVGNERRFFDYLRPADTEANSETRAAASRQVKGWIIQTYHERKTS